LKAEPFLIFYSIDRNMKF